jgi:hypothetical protein
LGPVLIGKTQTLFGGFIGLPELLHDGAPYAPGALRIEQIRYSHNFGGGLVFNIALESGATTSDAGVTGGSTDAVGVSQTPAGALAAVAGPFPGPQRWPDIVASLQWNFPNGALYGAGMIGQRNIDSGGPSGITGLQRDDSTIVWGASLGARYDFGRVEIGGQGAIGQGIGNKYFDGGATGFIDQVVVVNTANAGTDLRNVLVYMAQGYVQVKLTDTIRATGVFGWGMSEVLSELPAGTAATPARALLTNVNAGYWAAFGNLLWNPVPQVTLGAEYSFQHSFRYNAADVQAHRLQFAAIYRF